MRQHTHRGGVEGGFPNPQPMLQYFGGPVLHSHETFAVFWDPAGELPQSYRDLVTRFLGDVAAESGNTSNVFSVPDQYHDESGPIRYESTFAGSAVDQDPYSSGCPTSTEFPTCITDQQLASELNSYLTAHGIKMSSNRLFMVLLPPAVNTCFDSTGSFCSSTGYCGYHSDFVAGEDHVPYANLPYAARPRCDNPLTHPNASAADPVIFVLAHEQMEMVTDPLAGEAESLGPPIAWLDPEYGESSDKCEEYIGPVRKNGSGLYNQVINHHKYIVPMEWSNELAQAQGFGCVLTGGDHSPVAAFSTSVHRKNVTMDARLTTDPDPGDSVTSYHWHFGDGSSLRGPAKLRHRYTDPGTYTVTLYLADQAGAVTEVEHQVVVG